MKQRNRMKWGRVVDLSKDLHPCVFPLILSMYGTALISVPTTNVAVRIANFHVSPGTPIRVERAPQPTDIIWENQEWRRLRRFERQKVFSSCGCSWSANVLMISDKRCDMGYGWIWLNAWLDVSKFIYICWTVCQSELDCEKLFFEQAMVRWNQTSILHFVDWQQPRNTCFFLKELFDICCSLLCVTVSSFLGQTSSAFRTSVFGTAFSDKSLCCSSCMKERDGKLNAPKKTPHEKCVWYNWYCLWYCKLKQKVRSSIAFISMFILCSRWVNWIFTGVFCYGTGYWHRISGKLCNHWSLAIWLAQSSCFS